MIAQTLLELHAVAIGNGNVVHVHAEHQTAYVVSVGNTGCHTCPDGNLLLGSLRLPIAANHLAGYAHAGADVSELNVAMSRLVQVHEVHVHGIPGNLGIILGVEMEQGLLQGLQTLDPHLGRRECVHPGDDTDALSVVVGCLHNGLDLVGRVDGALVNNLDGDDARGIESINHFL